MWKQQKILSNYVTVKVNSDSTERFLNMCRHKNITFWNIFSTEEGFTGNISRHDFLQIKDICYKTKTKVRIKKRHGFRFLMFKYRKHYSFIAGIFAACVILYVCGLYIWNVSFTGNSRYTSSGLLKYLRQMNVYSGMRIKNVNCDEIERALRNEYNDITWVSAEIRGTRLVVHIKENDGAKAAENAVKSERDIVATKDGIVSSIVTRTGTPQVKKGDTVTAGQILVSGVVDVKDDFGVVVRQKLTSADADILIRVTESYEERLPEQYEYKKYTGRNKTKWLFGIKDKDLELGFSFKDFKEEDIITEVQNLKLTESFYLPFRVGRIQHLEYTTEQAVYQEEEAKQVLSLNFNRYLRELIENKVQILDNSAKIEKNGSYYVLTGTVVVDTAATRYTDITVPEIEGNEETE